VPRGRGPTRNHELLNLYTLTVFLGAALLFLVQPMVARMVLPSLGGAPAVWNTTQVFFQAALLLGYAYAHLSIRRLTARSQVALHAALLLAPVVVLPLAMPSGWTPPTAASPVSWLLALLTVAVGLPFFVLAASGPLLQHWFAGSGHRAARDPYFLFAASNLGSMLGLLGYPALVEPTLGLGHQSRYWTAATPPGPPSPRSAGPGAGATGRGTPAPPSPPFGRRPIPCPGGVACDGCSSPSRRPA
jgi:hypothetical protein